MHADPTAERMLLALAISGHPDAGKKFLALPGEVFTRGVHRAVAESLRDVINRDQRVHPPVIATDAARRAGTSHKAETINRFVTDLATGEAPPLEAWDFYAHQVADAARIRQLSGLGQRLTQVVNDADDIDSDTMARQLRVIADDIDAARLGAVAAPPISLDELLAEPEEAADWLVPGLLERMDRLIITGYEGLGKSELTAQLAVALAGGVHPFSGRPLHDDGSGLRVLVIDAENPRRMVQRRYRRVKTIMDRLRAKNDHDGADWSQLRFELHPGGIDLGNAREAAHLDERIAASSPDVVVVGPLYKLHKRDMNEEPAARELVGALDSLRARHGFALLLEAHSPHGTGPNGKRLVRPVGSSLFLRWPEFGYGLTPNGDHDEHGRPAMVELFPWRGAREQRSWPKFLRMGQMPTDLPWTPADSIYRNNER